MKPKKQRRIEQRASDAMMLAEMGKKFGQRVKFYREKKGITQEELADLIEQHGRAGEKCHVTTIVRIESGQLAMVMPLRRLLIIAAILGVYPRELIIGIRLPLIEADEKKAALVMPPHHKRP